MTYQVPAPKASYKQNRFEFTVPIFDDEGQPVPGTELTYSVPKMQYINSDVRQRMLNVSVSLKQAIDAGQQPDVAEQAEVTQIQRELFERYAPGLYGRVTDDQLNALMEAWQEASSISVGESSASAD